MTETKGNGGDHQWRGDWYPVTLIDADEDIWADYVKELCEDLGYISDDFPWWIEIDWYATAGHVAQDYCEVEFNGHTYYYRA